MTHPQSVKQADRSRTLGRVKEYRWQYAMFLPAAVLLILFNYMPMIGLQTAFRDFRLGYTIWNSPWCGFQNFEFLNDPHFWVVVRNTLTITVSRMLVGFPAPIILALLMNEIGSAHAKRLVQSISYMPHFISWIVVAYLLESLLSPTGLVNQIRGMLGHEMILFMGRPNMFSAIVVISGIWKEIGWNTIIYLAALSAIDAQLFEAAAVEGAGKFRQAIHITLPCIVPTIVLLLTLQMPQLIQAGMDQIYPLMNSANMSAAEVIDIYVLRNGLQQGYYGTSTALGLISSTLSLLLVLGTNQVARALSGEGLW